MNALAVDRIAELCAAANIAFATISTDYVFDGTLGRAYTEADAPNPRSAYGISKLAGELLVRRHGPTHFIFRLSGVYGASGTSNKGYTFIERVLQQAERGEPLRIVRNMTFSPTFAPHAARSIRDAIDARAFGTHHLTNAGATTWYDFAAAAFARSGLTPDIEALTYDNYGSAVNRPLYSASGGYDADCRRCRADAALGSRLDDIPGRPRRAPAAMPSSGCGKTRGSVSKPLVAERFVAQIARSFADGVPTGCNRRRADRRSSFRRTFGPIRTPHGFLLATLIDSRRAAVTIESARDYRVGLARRAGREIR